MSITIVTGTPGTGKTTYAKEFAKKQGAKYIDVNDVIEKYNLIEEFDKKRDCKVIDEEKLVKQLKKIILLANEAKESLVIDSHLSHELPKEYVDECYVMRTPIQELKRRLQERNYSEEKIQENVDAEIFEVILTEVKEQKHNYKIIDT